VAISSIDFSAQFGGLDAENHVLPHFKALKKACKSIEIVNFPFRNLTFILRVDGKIRSFNFSGLEKIKTASSKEYISIDLGIMRKDYGQIEKVISESVLSSTNLLINVFAKMKLKYDIGSLKSNIQRLVSNYKDDIKNIDL
jgi:hypothetical protein